MNILQTILADEGKEILPPLIVFLQAYQNNSDPLTVMPALVTLNAAIVGAQPKVAQQIAGEVVTVLQAKLAKLNTGG